LGEHLVLFSLCGVRRRVLSTEYPSSPGYARVQGTPCSSDFITTPVVKETAFRATGPLYKST